MDSCETLDSQRATGPEPGAANQATLAEAIEAADAGAAANRFANREIITYTVKDGDSLWEIARDYKIGIADIRLASGLAETETVILAGQSLKIPLPEGISAAPDAAGPAGSQPSTDAPPGTGRPPAPDGLPGDDIPAPEIRPTPLVPASSGLPAPPPPPGSDG